MNGATKHDDMKHIDALLAEVRTRARDRGIYHTPHPFTLIECVVGPCGEQSPPGAGQGGGEVE